MIKEMSSSPAEFVKNPGKDFTRKRKLPFESVIQLLLSMGGNSIYKELLEAQEYDIKTATTSAFVQQRDKILPSAFEFLFRKFVNSFADVKRYKGYRLLAADGSDLNIAPDSNDPETFFRISEDSKGYNLLHLNALYDLCSRLYVDARIQSPRQSNENKSLCEMVDCSPIEGDVIIMADRLYESYNNFAHIEKKGWNYVIRIKDSLVNGILSALPLPSDEEFDICFDRILTKKQTNEVKAHPDVYKFIPSKSTFDFLDLHTNKFYPISFRVVRFKVSDNFYETVITNLDAASFLSEELKMLYSMRWGIETSFRELKYAVGLLNFHAKKREFIIQEIFARMTMYNFAEMITLHVVVLKADTKHLYQVNYTVAIHICRRFLRHNGVQSPPDVEALISKNILPVRPGRKRPRKLRGKPAVSFVYRVA